MTMQTATQTIPAPTPAISRDARARGSKRIRIAYWMATALLCLQLAFTAYAQLTLPQWQEP